MTPAMNNTRSAEGAGEMVERVADALVLSLLGSGNRPDARVRRAARAAIEAMREPTEAMVWDTIGPMAAAGLDSSDLRDQWRAMIDAALTAPRTTP